MVACKTERAIDSSPYLKALLCHGLKTREVKENIGKEVKTSMMFTSVIRVEILNKVANVNEKVDCVVLESAGREVGVRANLHCLKGMFATRDTWADLVEEKACYHDKQLITLGSSRDWLDNRQNAIDKQVMKMECQLVEDGLQAKRIQACQDTQQASLNTLRWDLEDFHAVVTSQSRMIITQTEVVQEYSRRNDELSERVTRLEDEVRQLRAPQGRTLGDPILVEDDELEMKEEQIPGVVYDLIELDD